MELLLDYLTGYKVVDSVIFDLILTRGLDYDTCLIYEVTHDLSVGDTATTGKAHRFASIAAGEICDNLVGAP